MKTIIVPLDGSELAAQVLPYAQVLARTYHARLYLQHVITDTQRQHFLRTHNDVAWSPGEAPLDNEEGDERLFGQLQDYGRNYLESEAAPLREAGLEVELDVHFGSPADCILQAIERTEALMVAMATHGYSGLRRWALGSITDKIVHATDTPMFVVRGQAAPPLQEEPRQIRRILLPLDGSELSEQALPLATDLAHASNAELFLLQAVLPEFELHSNLTLAHVSPALHDDVLPEALHYDEAHSDTRSHAEKHLAVIASRLRQAGLTTHSHVSVGYPAEMIIEEAAIQHVDVIVMATHGYSGLKRWALGSVADKVLHATYTPLLLVRAQN